SEITLTPGTTPIPLSGNILMNSDGTITVSPETTADTYDYEYTICEKLNPSNCSTVISKVVVENNIVTVVPVVLYPVPVSNTLFISTNGIIGDSFYINIFDANGQLIYKKRESYTGEDFQVDTSKLSVGMYIINISSNRYKKESKFLKR
uniref:T9SS type A sorting domain-containing protein n=1 Tax=uncultured Tenacibaculum sp. TaxID=174713 RepID=UPI002635B0A3